MRFGRRVFSVAFLFIFFLLETSTVYAELSSCAHNYSVKKGVGANLIKIIVNRSPLDSNSIVSTDLDAQDNIYACGIYSGCVHMDGKLDLYQQDHSSENAGFVVKYDVLGRALWAANTEQCHMIKVDKRSIVTATPSPDEAAETRARKFSVPDAAHPPMYIVTRALEAVTNFEPLILRLDSSTGNTIWEIRARGKPSTHAHIAVDSKGDLIVLVSFTGRLELDGITPIIDLATTHGSTNFVLAMIEPSTRTLKWKSVQSMKMFNFLTLDHSDDGIYVAGISTESNVTFTRRDQSIVNICDHSAQSVLVIAHFSPVDGDLVWASCLKLKHFKDPVAITGITVNRKNVIITFTADGQSFTAMQEPLTAAMTALLDFQDLAFVAELPNPVPLEITDFAWNKVLGVDTGIAIESKFLVKTDSKRNVFVTGLINTSQRMLWKFSPTGDKLWNVASYASESQIVTSLMIDSQDGIISAGSFSTASGFDEDATEFVPVGSDNAFLVRYSDNCSCEDDKISQHCRIPVCFAATALNSTVCSSKGTCFLPDKCDCDQYHQGTRCELDLYFCNGTNWVDQNACSGGGKCVAADVCECRFFYYGPFCQYTYMSWAVAAFGGSLVFLFLLIIAAMTIANISKDKIRSRTYLEEDDDNPVQRQSREKKQINTSSEEISRLLDVQPKPKFSVDASLLEIKFSEFSDLQEIGCGASGSIVFKAKWKVYGGKYVCLKLFQTTLLSQQIDFSMFEREAKLLSSLRHPNILPMFGVCLESPYIALVSEFCEMGNMATVILKNKKNRTAPQSPTSFIDLSWRGKMKLLLDVASGIKFLHDRKIVHRDLKLENILIDKNGTAKIGDFGSSRKLNSSTNVQSLNRMTRHIGTAYYVAPEVVLGNNYDEKCDVFSFAIVMYELIMETITPYEEEMMNIELVVSRNPTFRPKIPQSFAITPENKPVLELMQQCWVHDPKRRPNFASIVEVLEKEI